MHDGGDGGRVQHLAVDSAQSTSTLFVNKLFLWEIKKGEVRVELMEAAGGRGPHSDHGLWYPQRTQDGAKPFLFNRRGI